MAAKECKAKNKQNEKEALILTVFQIMTIRSQYLHETAIADSTKCESYFPSD